MLAGCPKGWDRFSRMDDSLGGRQENDSQAATTETQKVIRRNVYFIPALSSSRAVSCVRRPGTLKFLF